MHVRLEACFLNLPFKKYSRLSDRTVKYLMINCSTSPLKQLGSLIIKSAVLHFNALHVRRHEMSGVALIFLSWLVLLALLSIT